MSDWMTKYFHASWWLLILRSWWEKYRHSVRWLLSLSGWSNNDSQVGDCWLKEVGVWSTDIQIGYCWSWGVGAWNIDNLRSWRMKRWFSHSRRSEAASPTTAGDLHSRTIRLTKQAPIFRSLVVNSDNWKNHYGNDLTFLWLISSSAVSMTEQKRVHYDLQFRNIFYIS